MRLTLSRNSLWVALASLSVCAALMVSARRSSNSKRRKHLEDGSTVDEISFACIGNSMQYYNDCPRLLQQMIEATSSRTAIGMPAEEHQSAVDCNKSSITCHQDSCLRGGASLVSIWSKGNGMAQKFATVQAVVDEPSFQDRNNPTIQYDIGAASPSALLAERQWDFVIFNDFTQAPARAESVAACKKVLKEKYAPMLESNSSKSTVAVFIQTPAYRKAGIKESDDLGNFEEFSDKLAAGLRSYVEALTQAGVEDCRIAPVGEAYRHLKRHQPALWKKLYSWDDFHPSPYGTFLQACVLYCTMFSANHNKSRNRNLPLAPPVYNALWWEQSRYMQPPEEKPLPLPTNQEADDLRRVAMMICGVYEEDFFVPSSL